MRPDKGRIPVSLARWADRPDPSAVHTGRVPRRNTTVRILPAIGAGIASVADDDAATDHSAQNAAEY
jgi:hypothetical protein